MFYKGKESLLEKKISPLQLLVFGLGNILGPQVFIMLAGLILIAGIYGIYSLILCSIICFLIAMNYLEIGLSMPMAGVVVNSVHDSFGGFLSFLVGWSQLFSNISFAAVCAIGFGMFIGKPILGAAIILIAITLLELKGISDIGKIETFFVVLMFIFFGALIIGNMTTFPSLPELSLKNLGPIEFRQILLGVGFFFLAFTNFEDLATYVEEIKSTKKLPMVMFGTIFIISILFILIYFVLLSWIKGGNSQVLENPLNFLSANVFGRLAGLVVAAIGMIASMTALTGSLSSSARNVYSLSEKKILPSFFFRLSKNGVPVAAVILCSFLVLGIIFAGQLTLIIYLANFIYFFITIFVALSVIKLREKRKEIERPFKTPLFPLVPVLTIGCMATLIFFLNIKSIGLGIIWLFVGFILYMFKAVGEHRLKIAIVGGSIFSSLLFIPMIYMSESTFSKSKHPVSLFLILIQLVFILLTFMSFNHAKTSLEKEKDRNTRKRLHSQDLAKKINEQNS
ncbi:MAG: APC family permease [Nanoarchaeota archaeon]|nr:APC family permease [Nanoarchaeota archaeon]